ncbi:hypothetical protein KW795_00810 [Candidatus Microgenomates bacterium]|nr:hypothetical protein [Candidatus Microgenomates bacterium]
MFFEGEPVPFMNETQSSFLDELGEFRDLANKPYDYLDFPQGFERPGALFDAQAKFYRRMTQSVLSCLNESERNLLLEYPYGPIVIVDKRTTDYWTDAAIIYLDENKKIETSPFINPIRDREFYAGKFPLIIFVMPTFDKIQIAKERGYGLIGVEDVLTENPVIVLVEEFDNKGDLVLWSMATETATGKKHRKLIFPESFTEIDFRQDNTNIPGYKIIVGHKKQEVVAENIEPKELYYDELVAEIPWKTIKDDQREQQKRKMIPSKRTQNQLFDLVKKAANVQFSHLKNLFPGCNLEVKTLNWETATRAIVELHMIDPNGDLIGSGWKEERVDISEYF